MAVAALLAVAVLILWILFLGTCTLYFGLHRGRTVYDEKLPDFGDVISVADFRDACKAGMFIDYDGFGHPMKNDRMASGTRRARWAGGAS